MLRVAALTLTWSAYRSGVKPNVRTYTALVTALGNAQQWDRALKLLRGMKQPHGSSIEPNAYTYSALIKALGEQVHFCMLDLVPTQAVPDMLTEAPGDQEGMV